VKVVFLTLDEVIALHADQIERYGGRPGIRDLGLLQSALGTPLGIARGRVSKAEAAVFVQQHLRPRSGK
jgi:death-on-curing protein